MPRFDRLHNAELMHYLHGSCIHDAIIQGLNYDSKNGIFTIDAINPIFDVRINFAFYEVELALAIKGHEFGSQTAIVSLTAEEDFSYLNNYYPKYGENKEAYLYLLFQTFSGSEIHIISKEVVVEIEK